MKKMQTLLIILTISLGGLFTTAELNSTKLLITKDLPVRDLPYEV